MLQNLIPSFPWIAPGWRAWGRNPRKGSNFAIWQPCLKGWKGGENRVADVEACRTLCLTEGAKFFTFRKKKGTCWCKSTRGRAGPQDDEDAHSGTVLDQDRNLDLPFKASSLHPDEISMQRWELGRQLGPKRRVFFCGANYSRN